jgi:hypothetical protein
MVSLTGDTVGFFFCLNWLILAWYFCQSGEMVDAQDLGSCIRKDVEVRVLSLAPINI